jgi:hypothetical protein
MTEVGDFCDHLCSNHPRDSQVYQKDGAKFCENSSRRNLTDNQKLACAALFG